MQLPFVLGFLIASLLQAGIVLGAEAANLTSLNASVPLWVHLVVGQIAGFLLLYLVNASPSLASTHFGSLGAAYGLALWAVVLTTASLLGVVRAPWDMDFQTMLFSISAFVIYGMTAAYTVTSVRLRD